VRVRRCDCLVCASGSQECVRVRECVRGRECVRVGSWTIRVASPIMRGCF